jgi:hypothetical protein
LNGGNIHGQSKYITSQLKMFMIVFSKPFWVHAFQKLEIETFENATKCLIHALLNKLQVQQTRKNDKFTYT